jgi:hypothetical protein
MKNPRILFTLGLLLVGLMLGGCFEPAITPPEDLMPPRPGNYALTGSANYESSDLSNDPYPLFVGARWLYHNSAPYWNPAIASSGLLESEVVAVVQGDGVQCYVLKTQYSNGPDELLYLHRTPTGINLYGEAILAASGAQPTYSLHPSLAILELPLVEDASWELNTSEGRGEAYVYHPEVVAVQSGVVSTLLGTYSAIFLDAWRIHYQLPAGGPRFYGGPVQFLWYVPGVGVVKHVLNSVDYQLAEFRLRSEVLVLTGSDAGRTVKLPSGGLVTVQLRGNSDPQDKWAWTLFDIQGTTLESLFSEFYADVYPPSAGTGTYTFQFRALGSGATTLVFELSQGNIVGDRVSITVVVQ